MDTKINIISRETGVQARFVENTVNLLESGCTIPFISRYRKEATGGLDEVKVAAISDVRERLLEIEKRKTTILSTIEGQGKLTPELQARIADCWVMTELEDIYLPYKPKRHTRAEVAREKGLEPLANYLMLQVPGSVERKAQGFVNAQKGVASIDEALKGAVDIIAERVSENERARNTVRGVFRRQAVIASKVVKGKEEEGQKYRDYFKFEEPLQRCASHRMLAMRRGEAEGILKISMNVDADVCVEKLNRIYIKGNNQAAGYVQEAVKDSYKRLLAPSIETEFMAEAKARADEEAIAIFQKNLEQLLMASPLGQKRVLGIDPGFRTGCKVVCLDSEGKLLHNEAIYPHPPKNESAKAASKLLSLVKQYHIEAISIGNGTAGRETEDWVRGLLGNKNIEIYVVSEDGASIYSASKVAREEFPDYDVTVRGAVSIGRRLMDPLAELVKIDPSSVGVGQYQKDVNQSALKKSLDQTVENCVNRVGVNVNTASKHLLNYVSGLGPLLAQNIVDYREENGAFQNRKQLLKVPRMGAKAFEQSAGFLRISGSEQPLDNSAVHPESYAIVEKMAKDLKCTVKQLVEKAELRQQIKIENYVTEQVGLPTLQDIMKELEKPGRDPREPLKAFAFDDNVHELKDVRPGMVLPGIVSNITNFGCFVDVGVHTKGLVHISQMSDHFVKDPTQIVSLHQQVLVRVLEVDLQRERMSLKLVND
ncbi:MAG: RNA-binding transcriptional accessory protein [Bacteroidales bacterium]|nr:RNA-binding transcriptional accessory protein [Candidatus Minthousia equi]